jgi:hypothetical protein
MVYDLSALVSLTTKEEGLLVQILNPNGVDRIEL